MTDRLWPLGEWLGRDVFDRARIEGAVLDAFGCQERLEVPSCNSLSGVYNGLCEEGFHPDNTDTAATVS